jgi:SAM-dependent methyltransferase
MDLCSIPSGKQHRSDARILNRRSLERDFRRLAEVLRPGMSVLDVGCGTGAITAGIARQAGTSGRAVGVDRDESLLAIARTEHGSQTNLSFLSEDALTFAFVAEFDIVASARTLQWVSDPGHAIARMARAARPGGQVVVLDYCHALSQWEPEPPLEFLKFYSAFLAWREANSWSNRFGDELPALFAAAGLRAIETRIDDEIVERGEPDFDRSAAIWTNSIESIGESLIAGKFWTEADRQETLARYKGYVASDLRRQWLAMRSVAGTRANN